MSWYLLPGGRPAWAPDGTIRAQVLLTRGARVLLASEVTPARESWQAGQSATVPERRFVTDTELAAAIAAAGSGSRFIGIDEDGVPYFDPAGIRSDKSVGVGIDADGVPFFSPQEA